ARAAWDRAPRAGAASQRQPCDGLPLFVRPPPAISRSGRVTSLVLPALLDESVRALAEQMAEQPGAPTKDASRIVSYLSALVGRLMPCGGWMAGEREAGAEPLVTARSRPYDESTLRKRARELAQHGGVDIVARAVQASVEQAVSESNEKATA